MTYKIKKFVCPLLCILLLFPLLFSLGQSPSELYTSSLATSTLASQWDSDDFPDWADGTFSGTMRLDPESQCYLSGYLQLGRTNTTGLFRGAWNTTQSKGHIKGIFGQGIIIGFYNITGRLLQVPVMGTLLHNRTHFTVEIPHSRTPKFQVSGIHHESFLPPLTGPYKLGTTIFHLTDPNRDEEFTEDPEDTREFMMQLWYPRTHTDTGQPAPYMDSPTFQWLKYQSPIPLFWIPDHAHTFITTHAHINTPPLQETHPFPLIIFSHGYNGVRAIYTTLIEDLVSHGFVIAAIDHPYIAGITVFPDGHTIELAPPPTNPNDAQHYFETAFNAVVGDVQYTLEYLTHLAAIPPWDNHLDVSHVGIYGHSFGGGAAAMTCYTDDRVIAGAALDGYFRDDVITQGFKKPFLMMLAEDRFAQDNASQTLWDNIRGGAFRAEVTGSTHYGYTDVGILLTHLTPLLPIDALGFGTIPPKRLVQITNAYNHAFFSVYLKNENMDTLLALSQDYEEVTFTYKL